LRIASEIPNKFPRKAFWIPSTCHPELVSGSHLMEKGENELSMPRRDAETSSA
jgi:hypothetical protein